MDLKILNIQDTCTACGACVSICPKQALSLKGDSNGFYYPSCNPTACVDCKRCEKVCHVLNNTDVPILSVDNFYLYQSIDNKTLENSSSGGAFSLFANWTLSQNGVVFGSYYNGRSARLEVANTDKVDLQLLKKSKYIESYTGDSFSDVRKYLIEGRKVLYCGTPCQIKGLVHFLKISHTNSDSLITMDFACHGVPSCYFFSEFKKSYERKNRYLENVDFRYKDFNGGAFWHDMALKLSFSDRTEIVIKKKDPGYFFYYKLFLDNLILRKSCYNCDIVLHSRADVTLGDFWGVNIYKPEIDDNKGISFLRFNNDKCRTLFDEIKNSDYVDKLPYESISYQFKDKRNVRKKELEKRNQYLKKIDQCGFRKAVIKQYGLFHIFTYKYYSPIVDYLYNLKLKICG